MMFTSCLALSGCLADQSAREDYVSTRALHVAHRSADSDNLWNTTKQVLRDNGFRLDRVDRHAGIITTMPATSRQFFEFWRKDVCTRADAWEATLNPIRRWIEVRFTPDENHAWREAAVVVHKERFSSYDRQFNSTGASYQVFGTQLPSTTGARDHTPEHDRWLDLGRDRAMEDHLLRQIVEQACVKTENNPSAQTEPKVENQ